MSNSQLIIGGAAASVALSSKLFSMVLNLGHKNAIVEPICPLDELCVMTNSLDAYCTAQQSNPTWQMLLDEEQPQMTESRSWNEYLGPILAFKLVTVLTGAANRKGKIPRSAMSTDMSAKFIRLAKVITESDGWPSIFEEAIAAMWNSPPQPDPGCIVIQNTFSQSVPQKVAASVVQNLNHLCCTFQSRFVGNIIQNIQLAASYLGIMTLGVIDITTDKDFSAKLDDCLKRAAGHSDGKVMDILNALGLTLVQFQAPLFCSLVISPIILFRTCSIVTSRFGRQHYLSLLMNLGDIKPASLRDIESFIWKNLYLVARNEITAEDMMTRVIYHIVPLHILESFRQDKYRLHRHLKEKFDPIQDHTSFFFPASSAIIKLEGKSSKSSSHEKGSSVVFPPELGGGISTPHETAIETPEKQPLLSLETIVSDVASDVPTTQTSQSELSGDASSTTTEHGDWVPTTEVDPTYMDNTRGIMIANPIESSNPSDPQSLSNTPSVGHDADEAVAPEDDEGPAADNNGDAYDANHQDPGTNSTQQPPSPAPDSNHTYYDHSPLTGSGSLDEDVDATEPPLEPDHTQVQDLSTVEVKNPVARDAASRKGSKIPIVIRRPKLSSPKHKRNGSRESVSRKRFKSSLGRTKIIQEMYGTDDESAGDDNDNGDDNHDGDDNNADGDSDDNDDDDNHNNDNDTDDSMMQSRIDQDMDVDIDEDWTDNEIPRFEVCGDKERIVSPAIYVYSADHTKCYQYQGKHYNPQIAEDLQELALHVDDVRQELGLNFGRPSEWLDGMVDPVITSKPWAPQQTPICLWEASRADYALEASLRHSFLLPSTISLPQKTSTFLFDFMCPE